MKISFTLCKRDFKFKMRWLKQTFGVLMTLSESYCQATWTSSGLILTVFTLSQSYYQIIVNTFLRIRIDTSDRKLSNRKFPSKSEKN